MADDWVTVTTKKKQQKPWSESVRTSGQLETKTEITGHQLPLDPQTSSSLNPISHKLHDTWVIWSHEIKGPTANDWTVNGYSQLIKFNTIEDFWIIYNNLNDLTDKMYYLMRDGYVPIWESPENIDGGAWTFKIDKKLLANFWRDLSCYCVGETVCENSEKIVGLSISPKIRYATVRVWTSNTSKETMACSQFKKILEETANSDVIIDFSKARFEKNREAST